jgi:hypothetical protein
MISRKKLIAIILISVAIVSIPLGIYFGLNQANQTPSVFSLIDAPQEIIDIQQELSEKARNGSLSMDDMPQFIIFAEYVGNNAPEILNKIQGLDQQVLFRISDGEDLLIDIFNNELHLYSGEFSEYFEIIVTMDSATLLGILKQEFTAQTAYLKGWVQVKGSISTLQLVLSAFRIIIVTMLQGSSEILHIDITKAFSITSFSSTKTIPGGLTIFPCAQVIVNQSSPIGAQLSEIIIPIVDYNGKIINSRTNSPQTTHHLLNSSWILMGSSAGYLDIWNWKTNGVVSLPIPAGHHYFDYSPS